MSYQHEALDRLHVAQDTIYTHVLNHKFINENPKLYGLVTQACQLLGEAYQVVGSLPDEQSEDDKFAVAFSEWMDKTDWVRAKKDFPFSTFGIHRADVMRKYIEHLEAQLAAVEAKSPQSGGMFDAVRESAKRLGQTAQELLDLTDNMRTGYVKPAPAVVQEPIVWECKAGGLKPLTQTQYDKQPEKIQRHYIRIPAVAVNEQLLEACKSVQNRLRPKTELREKIDAAIAAAEAAKGAA